MAIVECDGKTFGRYVNIGDGRLYIDTRACRSFEYVRVMRCFKCHQSINQSIMLYCQKMLHFMDKAWLET